MQSSSTLSTVRPNAWKVSKIGRGFKHPDSVASGPNNFVYVVDAGNGVIKKVAPNGKTTIVVKRGNLFYYYNVGSLSLDDTGQIFVTDSGFVFRFNAHGMMRSFGYPGDSADSLAVDYSSARVYVYDYNLDEIQRYDPPYAYYQFKVIYRSSSVGAMSVGKDGYLYLTDGCAVEKISPDGKAKTRVARGLKCPQAIAADETGKVFALDNKGQNVEEAYPSGKIATLGTGFNASAIAVDSVDNVYLSEPYENDVLKLSSH